ncbi:hypothetical protein EX895_004770 [Sporisorium graminicola]|uniref:VHS domain-containing protein n=1 Tax=Sporisorium graminicola TaxID=280036 RepID=A0A4U7KNB3_9BASI|nr:hypothetical protein EX895_004770 [Sporisorium graminicola]TKY85945.1 hypothetical protein EX895_004770 [Sporisorium graminicola]
MKKFFKSKEAGTITPLPPTSPAAPSSYSFGTPRLFDEYQARVASQSTESRRPLSLQPPTSNSSRPPPRDSSDDLGYAHAYSSPPLSSSSSRQRHSQQMGASPRKKRFSTQVADTTVYESYSDPNSHSQPYRPSYDSNHAADYDDFRLQPSLSQPPLHANARLSFQQQQQPASGIAAFSPPKSLRPAQPPAHHRRDNSLNMGIITGAAHQNGSADLSYARYPPANVASTDATWPVPHQRRSEDSDDADHTRHNDGDDDGADADVDGRTPTASSASRSAAYPVYSGADGDEDANGEVLISHGRYEEPHPRELDGKDKVKAKKLFGFATISNKDKKAKQDRDRAAPSPSPVPRASRDRDDARLMAPLVELRSLSAQDRNKEGWMDRWNKRAHHHQAARVQDKEAEEIAGSRIGWLCANAYSEHDWMHILPLIDMVGHSEAASKEAARALRKEFKYGSVDSQRRAVRVWALLTLNGSDRFRLQVASKRFLEAIEETVASPKTPLSVKETMLRVLGVLAFEFRGDAELVSVTKCWNKVKPSDRRKDGEPLEDDLFEFRLPQPRTTSAQQQQQPPSRHASQRRSQPPRHPVALNDTMFDATPLLQHQQPLCPRAPPPMPASLQLQAQPPLRQPQQPQQQHEQPWLLSTLPAPNLDPHPHTAFGTLPSSMPVEQQPTNGSTTTTPADIVSNLEAAAASMDSRSASYRSSSADDSLHHHQDVVTFDEDVRRLHEECQIARSNAAVLLDTLLHEGLHPDTAELVDEFYGKVVRSQELISSQIGWASAQADRSRLAIGAAERETGEEALLADLLEAHGRTSEAVRVVEDARRRIEEEEAERRVTERSKVEVRLVRSALVQDAAGDVYDLGRGRGGGGGGLLGADREMNHASGSRSPSPYAAIIPARAAASALSPNAAFSPPSNGAAVGYGGVPPRISRPLPVPRSDQSSDSNNSTHSFAAPPAGNSLTASSHSTHSNTSTHSLNPVPSGGGSGGRSPLPLTPTLNIDIKQQQKEAGSSQDEDEDELQTPVVPSAKALGKRRAVSVRYPTPPGTREAPPPQLPPLPPGSAGTRDVVNGVGGLKLT